MPVIGSLHGVAAADWAVPTAGFRRGLGEAGFVEGRNVAFEYRWAEGQFDRIPAMVADLVGRKVAVIFSGGSDVATRAAQAATRTIPIVFTTGSDPVAVGLVASLNRPGSNATGITVFNSELGPKKLELLHEMIPSVTKIALLVNPTNPVNSANDIRAAQVAVRRLGLEIVIVSASTANEIESAFATAVEQRAAALQSGADAFLTSRREQMAALGLRHALPTIATFRDSVQAGMLMSYGAIQGDTFREAGAYVGRILKGEKPADLPVMQPTRFELVVNLKTAKAIGLSIPETFLVRADEVIE
jgi:putative ABC transport system substrate-binding protein